MRPKFNIESYYFLPIPLIGKHWSSRLGLQWPSFVLMEWQLPAGRVDDWPALWGWRWTESFLTLGQKTTSQCLATVHDPVWDSQTPKTPLQNGATMVNQLDFYFSTLALAWGRHSAWTNIPHKISQKNWFIWPSWKSHRRSLGCILSRTALFRHSWLHRPTRPSVTKHQYPWHPLLLRPTCGAYKRHENSVSFQCLLRLLQINSTNTYQVPPLNKT